MLIKMIEGGPAIVIPDEINDNMENIDILLPDGKVEKKSSSFAICRCGQSKNGVFCDGTHAKLKQ